MADNAALIRALQARNKAGGAEALPTAGAASNAPDDPATASIMAALELMDTTESSAGSSVSTLGPVWGRVDELRSKGGPRWTEYDPRDLPLYKEAAYGTPLDAYLNGGVARGMPTPEQLATTGAVPPLVPSTDSHLHRYAALLKSMLERPTVALGASEPSRIGLADEEYVPFAAIGKGRAAKIPGVRGFYDQSSDIGAAGTDPMTLPHEFAHRGMDMIGVPVWDHHRLMNEDAWRWLTPSAQVDDLNERARARLPQRQGGPR